MVSATVVHHSESLGSDVEQGKMTTQANKKSNILEEVAGEVFYTVPYLGLMMLTPIIGAVPHINPEQTTKSPVVIIPGFFGRPQFFKAMRDQIISMGHPCFVFEAGINVGCIKQKSRKLQKMLMENNLHDVVLIGHSMGGLIAAQVLSEGQSSIKHVIALGTPFHGSYLHTALLLLCIVVGYIGYPLVSLFLLCFALSLPGVRQLLPCSSYLQNLRNCYSKISPYVTSLYSDIDPILVDSTSAFLFRKPDDKSLMISTFGHTHFGIHSTSIEMVMGLLNHMEAEKEKKYPDGMMPQAAVC